MLFATTSAFVSCKDTDADYKTETDAKIAKLQSDLASLQALVSSIKSCNCDMTSINNKLAALEAAINAINLNDYVKTADLPDAVKALLSDYCQGSGRLCQDKRHSRCWSDRGAGERTDHRCPG
jgi:hypothetical protein